MAKKYEFPVGWHNIHPDMSFNFQMNRFYSLTNDAIMLEELQKVSSSLHTYQDYIQALLKLSQESLQKNEKLRAAVYMRGAEFFIGAGGEDKDKKRYRTEFIYLMREHSGIGEDMHYRIPYETGCLSAYRFTPKSPKGTIVVFGGYDSYIEEFFPMLLYVKDCGYDVVCFEGPGQGSPLEDYMLPMTNEWEKPVKAVLDYFSLDDVALMGVSMGGYLVIRAAAYEKRVKRVIADGAVSDFFNAVYSSVDQAFREKLDGMIAANERKTLNTFFENLMKTNLLMDWAVKQGMHIMGAKDPFDYVKSMKAFVSKDISNMLTQDVLLMAGQNDHYIPVNQFYDQIRTLTNVRSLTARLFTKAENAQNHCQVGNIGLSLDVIVNWLDQINK